jgi:prepilin-type N-terminal cleavage/methylation domain-containing protein
MSSRATGFTLVELLIVIVIVGILVAIAIPQFHYTRERAFTATMKHDLKNLSTAQEAYFIDNQAYSGTLGGLTTGMKLSTGVSISISNATGTGFDATATHARTALTCSLVVSASLKGTPTCP